MQIIYDGRKVQDWEFVSQGLNIGKWSTGKHCDEVAIVKNVKTIMCPRRWHPSFKLKVKSRSGLLFKFDIFEEEKNELLVQAHMRTSGSEPGPERGAFFPEPEPEPTKNVTAPHL